MWSSDGPRRGHAGSGVECCRTAHGAGGTTIGSALDAAGRVFPSETANVPVTSKGPAGMAWIEVHQPLVSHKKTMALCDALAIEPAHAVGHLVCLWLWSIDNAPHGDLSEVGPATIASAAGWPRAKAKQFLDAVVQSGFLEQRDGRLHIHDFDDYIGKLIARREANVMRTRASRTRHVTRTPPESSRDVTSTNGVGNGATQQYTTQHNTTGQPPPSPPPSRDANACCAMFELTGQHKANCTTRVSA